MSRAAAAAAAILVAACAAAATGAAAPGPVEIGLVVPCGGAFAAYGDAALAAAQTGLLEALGGRPAGTDPRDGVLGARAGGRAVRLRYACSDGDPGRAVRAAERLRTPVVVGGFTGEEGAALARFAAARADVTVVGGSAAARVPASPRFFSFAPSAGQWTAGLATYAYRALGWRRAAIVADDDALGRAQAAAFAEEFCALGGRVPARVDLPLRARVDERLARRLPRRVDGVFASTTGSRAADLADVLPALAGPLQRRLALGVIGLDERFADRLGARADGVVAATPYPSDAPAFRRYLAAFDARYPHVPAADALVAVSWYAGGAALGAALRSSGGDTGARLRAALSRTRVTGPGGPVRLDARRRAVVTTAVVERTGGAAATVARFRGVASTFAEGSGTCVRRPVPAWARSLSR